MAVCDLKVAHIDKAVALMASAIKLLKEHRKSALLYKDTDASARKLTDDIYQLATELSHETLLFHEATRILMAEVGGAVPAAPVARKVCSPRSGAAY